MKYGYLGPDGTFSEAAVRKLAKPPFVSGAPAAVVEEHRRRQTDAASRLEKLRGMLEALG